MGRIRASRFPKLVGSSKLRTCLAKRILGNSSDLLLSSTCAKRGANTDQVRFHPAVVSARHSRSLGNADPPKAKADDVVPVRR